MSHSSPSYIAGADVAPCRFVKISGGDHTVIQCVAGDRAVGVSAENSREAPIPSVSTVLHAKEGEPVHAYGMGESCEVTAGGAITAGDYLKPDADGKAVTIVPGVSPVVYSAVARSSAAVGEKVKVLIQTGTVPVA